MSDHAQRRKEWLRQKGSQPGTADQKRRQWQQAKSDNEQTHIHFNCTCQSCGQEFMICGLPCFIICPGCHLALALRFS
jgi:hypothetical protein